VSFVKKHVILGNIPVTLFVSDQNFVESLPGTTDGSCSNVVRLQDVSLGDLMDLVLEIFKGCYLLEDSVVLFGSASYLHRIGVMAYAIA
jgi:hypothetical protein